MPRSNSASFKYRGFISYSHRDARAARRLHRTLESYRIPKSLTARLQLDSRALGVFFRDTEELPSTGDLRLAVTEALADSEFLIVICSPGAANSRWVNEEIRFFLEHRDPAKVLCALIAGEPGESIPAAFQTADIEPGAADFRYANRRFATQKLIAGLLDIGFDELRRRDLQARHRRLAIVTGLLVVALGTTAGLATVAVIARKEAEAQRDLVTFEVETLRGTGDLLIDVFQRNMDAVPALELIDRAELAVFSDAYPAATRARMMHTIARIRVKLGQFERAMALFETSLRMKAAEVADDHATVAVGFRDLGILYADQLQLGAGVAMFERALAIAEETDPEGEEVANVLGHLGELYLEFDDIDKAAPLIEASLEIRQRLDSTYLVFAYNRLGGLRREQQRFAEAEEAFNAVRATAIRQRGPDSGWVRVVDVNKALMRNEMGDHALALELIENRMDVLNADDRQRGILFYTLGDAELGLGKSAAAARNLHQAIELVTKPDIPPKLRVVAISAYLRLAETLTDPQEKQHLLESAYTDLKRQIPLEHPQMMELAAEIDATAR